MRMLKAMVFSLYAFTGYGHSDGFALLPGRNRDLVLQNCVACHSDLLIVQNHMTRKSWDEKITWMQKTQNLWPLASDVRSKILDYLEKTQGPSSTKQPRDFMDDLNPRRTNPLLFEEKSGG